MAGVNIAGDALRRALSVAVSGGGNVSMPQVTTRQAKRSAGLLARAGEALATGGRVYFTDQWQVEYEAAALPDESDPAWTEELDGTVTATVSGGLLNIVPDTASDTLYYTLAATGVDADLGTTIEANLRVNSDVTSGADSGAALAVEDGAALFVVWLRADGLNIHGSADVPMDLSDVLHRVKLVTRAGLCELWVDGLLRQQGAAGAASAASAWSFGSYMPGLSVSAVVTDVDWDWVRAMPGR